MHRGTERQAEGQPQRLAARLGALDHGVPGRQRLVEPVGPGERGDRQADGDRRLGLEQVAPRQRRRGQVEAVRRARRRRGQPERRVDDRVRDRRPLRAVHRGAERLETARHRLEVLDRRRHQARLELRRVLVGRVELGERRLVYVHGLLVARQPLEGPRQLERRLGALHRTGGRGHRGAQCVDALGAAGAQQSPAAQPLQPRDLAAAQAALAAPVRAARPRPRAHRRPAPPRPTRRAWPRPPPRRPARPASAAPRSRRCARRSDAAPQPRASARRCARRPAGRRARLHALAGGRRPAAVRRRRSR